MFVERLPDPRKTSLGNSKEFQRSLVLRATSTKNLVCQGLKRAPSTVQIKNIKLHIVTDIKVTINSLSVFGFRYLVGGRATILTNEKVVKVSPAVMVYVKDYFQALARPI